MRWDFLAWKLAETLPEAASTVLPPDLASSSSNGNHDISGSFCHFFIVNSYDDKICFNDWKGLIPKHIVNQQFYSRQLFAALALAVAKMRASIIAQTGGGGGF
jgi:hypothetical protein